MKAIERLDTKREEYGEAGVIHLPGALDAGTLARLQEIYAATLSTPSVVSTSYRSRLPQGSQMDSL